MSWWDSAYKSGRVSWDPGAYDRHLDWVLENIPIPGTRALDIGCGTGKSAIWLARQGFDVTGIDSAKSAIDIARRKARRENATVRFVAASFPTDIDELSAGGEAAKFHLVTERATLQHIHSPAETVMEAIAQITVPRGVFYSLMLTGEGLPWGTGAWNERTIRKRFGEQFDIEHIDRVVFTPGQPGSVPAWRTVARKPE